MLIVFGKLWRFDISKFFMEALEEIDFLKIESVAVLQRSSV